MSNNTSNLKAYLGAREAVVSKVFALFALIMSAVATFMYLGGTVLYYGRAVDAISAINLFLGILKLGDGAFYRIGFGVLFAVLYVIFGVFVIKNFIHSIVIFSKVMFGREQKLDDTLRNTFYVGQDACSNFIITTIMIFIGGWINMFQLSANAKYIFVLGIVTLILNHVIYYILQGQTFPSFLMHTGFYVVSIICAVTLLANMRGGYISDVIASVSIFFSGIEYMDDVESFILLTANIGKYIILIIIGSKALGIFSAANEYNSMRTREIRAKSRGLLITVGVLLTFEIVVFVITGADVDVESIRLVFDPYMPLLFSSVALLLSSCIDAEFKKSERILKLVPNAQNLSYLTKKGVLRIKSGATVIDKKEFAERRDITAVVIPATVSKVGKQAFYGCGAITAIYCEAQSCPDGWDCDWNDGCFATVHWGADLSQNLG